MTKGDLVRLRTVVHHSTGIYPSGSLGIVIKLSNILTGTEKETAVAAVRFSNNKLVRCYMKELEII
jgi:hypothetical protein